MITWILTAAVAADCGFATTEQELHETMDAAEQAYGELDIATFRDANDELRLSFPCVDAPLSPPTIARVARIRALALSTSGDDAGMEQALLTARELDPDYAFPAELVPEGHAIRVTYDALSTDAAPRARLERPRGVSLFVDGQEDLTRPTHRPAVLQVAEEGHVRSTQLLWPGDPAPDYPRVPVARNRLLLTAGGLLATSAALYGGAWASRGGLDTAEDSDALTSVQRRTNLLTGLSVGLAVGAGAATTGAVLVGPGG